MISKILEVFGLLWLIGLVLPFAGGCSLSQEAVDGVNQTVVSMTDAAIKLEEAGIRHQLDLYYPARIEANWDAFGFGIGVPGGYSSLEIGTGRGAGERPPDVPTGSGG